MSKLLSILIISACLTVSFGSVFQQAPRHNIDALNRKAKSGMFTDPQLKTAKRSEVSEEIISEIVKRDGEVVYISRIPFVDFTFITEDVVFGIDYFSRVFMSNNSMMSWTQVPIPSGDNIHAIYGSPANNKTIIFVSHGNSNGGDIGNWISEDLGLTYRKIKTTKLMDSMMLHPTQTSYVLGVVSGHLYFSDDTTATWTSVRDKLSGVTWCGAGLNGGALQRICMVTDVDPEELGLPSGTTTDPRAGSSRFVVTKDLGNSITVTLPYQCSSVMEHPLYMYAICYDTVEGHDDLFVSNDHGTTFHKALLAGGENVPYLYPEQFMDESYGAAWLAINHKPLAWGAPHYGNLYVSDTDGWRFDKSLEHVVTLNNWWDFAPVRSLEGVYIANTLVSWQDDNPDISNTDPLVKTQITFDNGDTWQSLAAPQVDSHGNPYNCQPPCSLNLFGQTTWLGLGGYGFYGDFQSSEHAIGIIVATGNVNEYLQYQKSQVNTYLSRDGGVSWLELFNNSSVFAIGDDGGVILFVANQVPIYHCWYTLSEGDDWYKVNFTTTAATIVNAWTTNEKSNRFVMWGRSGGYTTYYGIDFSGMRQKQCEIDKDYENWTSQNGANGGNCVLGRTTVYRRRLRDSECTNPDDLKHVVSVTNCNCTESDYECDYGYERTVMSGTCVQTEDTTDYVIQDVNEQCSSSDYYYATKGYRLVPGDSCVNHIDKYAPTKTSCSNRPATSTTTGGSTKDDVNMHLSGGFIALVVIMLVVVMFGGLLGGMFIGARSERVKKWFHFEDRKQGEVYVPVTDDDM